MTYTQCARYAACICVCTAALLRSQDTTHVHAMQLPYVIHDIIVHQAVSRNGNAHDIICDDAKKNQHNHMHIIRKTHKAITTQRLSELGIGYTSHGPVSENTPSHYDAHKAYHAVITLLAHKADPQQLYTGYDTDAQSVHTWQYDTDVKHLLNTLYPSIAHCSQYENLPSSIKTHLNETDIACIALAADNMDLPNSLIKHRCNFATHKPLLSEKQLYSDVYLHALELYIRSTQTPSDIRRQLRAPRTPRLTIGESRDTSIVNGVLGITEWNLPGYEGDMFHTFSSATDHDYPIMPGVDEWDDDIVDTRPHGTPNSYIAPNSTTCFFPDVHVPSLREKHNLAQFMKNIHTHHPYYCSHIIDAARKYGETGQITPNILEQAPAAQQIFL